MTYYIAFQGGLMDNLYSYGIKFKFPKLKFKFVVCDSSGFEGTEKNITNSFLNFNFEDVITEEEFLKEGHTKNELVYYNSTHVENVDQKIINYILKERWNMTTTYFGFLKEKLLNPIKPYSKYCLDIVRKIRYDKYSMLHLRINYSNIGSFDKIDTPYIQKWIDEHDKIILTSEQKQNYPLIIKYFAFKNKDVIELSEIDIENVHELIFISIFCYDILHFYISGIGSLLSWLCRGKVSVYR